MNRPPSCFEARVLGPTQLVGFELDHGAVSVRAPKRLALLAYLAIETADGFRRRDQIVSVFWPDLPQEAARTQLRKALSALRESLGPDAIITRGDSEVRLDDARVWCDAVAIDRYSREGRWTDALALYRGDLLEGLFPGKVAEEFHDWLADKRKVLRGVAALAAWECSRADEERGDRKAAAVSARRAIDLEPDDEEGIRRLMTLLDRHGDRGGALRVYQEWQTRLQEEFGVEPAPETRKLARLVQAARKGESHETPPTPAIPFALPPTKRSDPAGEERTPVAIPHARGSRRRLWFTIAGAAAFVLLSGTAALWGVTGSAVPAHGSVAVLSLRVVGDTLVAHASTVVEEELTTALIDTDSLTVRPASRLRRPENSAEDVEDIGRRLRVAYLVDGGVRQHDDGVRVTLRLVRATDGIALWAGSYDIDGQAVGAFSQRISGEVVPAIAARIRADTSWQPRR